MFRWLADLWARPDERDSWTVVEVIHHDPPVYVTILEAVPLDLARDVAYDFAKIDGRGPFEVKRSTEVLAAGGIEQRRKAFRDWRDEPR